MTRVDVMPAPDSKNDDDNTLNGSPMNPKTNSRNKTTEVVTIGDSATALEPESVKVVEKKRTKLRAGKETATTSDAECEVIEMREKQKAGKKSRAANKDDNDATDVPASKTVETDEELLTTMCCEGCTPRHSFRCRVLFFLVLFGLDVADLFSDWLLYADVSITEKGLVYGPPEDAAIDALLAFSIIGTLTFLFEAVNLWWEVFRENPWLDVDLVSAIIIWVEDLPQIAINVYIAHCREDPISIFQLTKASVVLIGLLVRIIISSVKYCNKRALAEANERTKQSRLHVAYRVFIMLGLLINSACAITVFIFTQTQRSPDGGILFQVPKTIFEDKYNDERYFQNVSIFIHHHEFDATPPNSATQFKANWVRFMSINDIRDCSDLQITYNYVYEKTTTQLKMGLFVKKDKMGNGQKGSWGVSECYQMDLTSRQVAGVSNATCQASFFSPQAKSIFITFTFNPPAPIFRKQIFGDIRFNVKTYINQQCSKYSNFSDVITSDNNSEVPTIHYYRTNASLAPNDTKHLLIEGGTPRFYRNDGVDLQDVTEVWKTGWGRCESSGSKAPHFWKSIPLECSNTVIPAVTG